MQEEASGQKAGARASEPCASADETVTSFQQLPTNV